MSWRATGERCLSPARWRRRGAALVLMAASFSVYAHDTWLLPATATVAGPGRVDLDFTSGMGFPALDHPVAPDRVARAAMRLNGRVQEVDQRAAAPRSLRLRPSVPRDGLATFWVETKPKEIELGADDVEHYLSEVGALETTGREWKELGSPKWRELYTKHAKTFVRVGEARGDRSWAEPAGMPLEIVPESDPTRLRRGDTFTVRLLSDGAPLAGQAVGFAPQGAKALLTVTDASGRATFRLERSGWILIRATRIVRSTGANAGWESRFTTLTVHVSGT